MKFLIAVVALLALCGSAMAWTLSDDLSYTYVKTGWQEAGDNLILGADTGATSSAHFYDPAVTNGQTGNFPTGSGDGQTFLTSSQATTIIPASAATVSNTLGAVTVDRVINYPATDLRYADFATQLTQGGAASVALHSISDNSIDPITGKATIPEMIGTADAYQNLNLAGGLDKASTTFASTATVGVDNLFAITQTGTTAATANSASVDSQTHGGGLIDSANLGEQVTSDVSKDFTNSAWQTPEYSGGIKMWADFTASDPTCSNPIISSVSGSSWTSLFPGNAANPNWGGDSYWGSNSVASLSPFKI